MRTNFFPVVQLFKYSWAFIFTIILTSEVHSQAFDWAVAFDGTVDDYGKDLVTDDNGNVYVTGYYYDTADFDPGPNSNILSCGSSAAFVCKLNKNGNFVWAKQFRSISDGIQGSATRGEKITIDINGDVLISGIFDDTIDFDPGAATELLISKGQTDIFIVKLDQDGNFKWAKKMGGPASDNNKDLYTNEQGDVFTSGSFIGHADFDPGNGQYLLTNPNGVGGSGYISKLDLNGNFVFALQLSGDINILGLMTDANGNIFITGSFHGYVDFDPGASDYTLWASGLGDIFLSKLNTAGELMWAYPLSGNYVDQADDLVLDQAGNVYVTGSFSNGVDFDPGIDIYNLDALCSDLFCETEIFVLKLSNDGSFMWAKSIGGVPASADYSRSIDISEDGKLFFTGSFGNVADFNPDTLLTNNLTSDSGGIYICEFDTAGNFVWAGNFAVDSHTSQAITVNPVYGVYSTGYFNNPGDFDPGPGTEILINPVESHYECYVHKMSQVFTTTFSSITIPSLKIFPNPAGDVLTVQYGDNKVPHTVLITDLMGREMIRKNDCTGLTHQIDVRLLSNGIYLLKAYGDNYRSEVQFVKK